MSTYRIGHYETSRRYKTSEQYGTSERPVTPLSPTSSDGSENAKRYVEFESPATSVSSVAYKITLSPEKAQQPQWTKAENPQEELKLVLFFDGTGNSFTGSSADTNVVKLLKLLNRSTPNQYHYYQTGIGTYGLNEESVNKSPLGEIRSALNKSIDMAVGTTFDSHVLAGYRFLMRYYETGAKIYMFGFSRGAFTARFLARLISTVGLLCKGNEEMVPFVYNLYQRYLTDRIRDMRDAQRSNDTDQSPKTGDIDDPDSPGLSDESKDSLNEIRSFSDTFCRKGENGKKIRVFFLGLWDCVGSVSLLDCKSPIPMPSKGTAQFVRHAVAADERRVKFKAALFAQDYCKNDTIKSNATEDAKVPGGHKARPSLQGFFDGLLGSENVEMVKSATPRILQDTAEQVQETAQHIVEQVQSAMSQSVQTPEVAEESTPEIEEIKEVWFPGGHGDVGGGWALEKGAKTQISDITLAWMIRELQLVEGSDESSSLKWSGNIKSWLDKVEDSAAKTFTKWKVHDSLSFDCGMGSLSVLLWKFMEIIPIIRRFELDAKTGKWKIG
ncbi:hypothetical protein V8C42DRAFT_339964 [Trichoderma barbatum]